MPPFLNTIQLSSFNLWVKYTLLSTKNQDRKENKYIANYKRIITVSIADGWNQEKNNED